MDSISQKNQSGEIWKRIQSEYGAKPKQQRKIKKQLDKDDFMKIMVTQMQHQDPTNPMDSDKLAAEIAQITSVEQLQNVNQALRQMSEKNKPLERMTMTNLIGKTVTVDENRFVHVAGQNENIKFNLPEQITTGKLTIISSSGEKIIEKDLGTMKAGPNSINWDGKKSNTIDALTGTYMIRIEAENENGSPVYASAISKSKIMGVSFEGNDPVFIVGNGQSQKRITMDSILTIEQAIGQPMQQAGQAKAAPSQLVDNTGKQRNVSQFFTFEKGKGSQSIDPNIVDPKTQQLLNGYQPTGAKINPADKQAVDAKNAQRKINPGFPNGLGKALGNKMKGGV